VAFLSFASLISQLNQYVNDALCRVMFFAALDSAQSKGALIGTQSKLT
jgi:hypothetical protein